MWGRVNEDGDSDRTLCRVCIPRVEGRRRPMAPMLQHPCRVIVMRVQSRVCLGVSACVLHVRVRVGSKQNTQNDDKNPDKILLITNLSQVKPASAPPAPSTARA